MDQDDRPDGNRWLTLDENTKYAYIVGFLEGMFLGHCFTTWNIAGGVEEDSAWQSATNSYNGNHKQFVSGTTYRQFFDGLNHLYADYRNRKIGIRNGMWVVMNEISGMSEEAVNTMIEAWRREASGEP